MSDCLPRRWSRTAGLVLLLLFVAGCGVPAAPPASPPETPAGGLAAPTRGTLRPAPARRGATGVAQASPEATTVSPTRVPQPTATLVPSPTASPTLTPTATFLPGSGACTTYQPEGTEGPIWDIEVSPEGNVWLAAYRGVAQTDPARREWTAYSVKDGLLSDQVRSITVEPDGSVWFAYRDKEGVSRFDGTRWKHYTADDGLISNEVNDVSIAPDGSVWFATAAGATHWDRQAKRWTSYTEAEGLYSNDVRKVVFTPDGTIWFAHFDALTSLVPAGAEGGEAEWGTYGESRAVATRRATVSEDGRLWLGQVYLDAQSQEWVETVYREIHLQGLAVDGQGGLWIGRQDGALYIADPVSDPQEAWQRYDTSVGLAGDDVQVIALEAQDVVWFGTGGGASRCVLDALAGLGDTPTPGATAAPGATPEAAAREVSSQPFIASTVIRESAILSPSIAYTQNTETGDEIFVLDLASEPPGSSPRTETVGAALRPRWSPDRRSIAFSYNDTEAGRVDLWAVENAGGTPPRALTEGGLGEMSDVSWSADGRYLVFHAVLPDGIDRDVVRLDVETGEAVNLTASSPAWDSDPRWSPDGAWIAFVSDRVAGSGKGQESIWRMAPDGGGLRQLTDSDWEDVKPGWSPDGDEVAFYRWSFLEPGEGGPAGLWVAKADGSGERLVIELDLLPTGFEAPAWSPDGAWIAYQAGPSNDADLYVVPAGGGEPVNVSTLPGHDYAASWSPDSRFVLFTNAAEGEARLFVAEVEGDGLWSLLEIPGNRLGVWAPAPAAGVEE